MKVKLFEEKTIEELERTVNEWVKPPHVKVIDIKYSSFVKYSSLCSYSAMLLYRYQA